MRVPVPRPSEVAAARFREALHARIEEYRRALSAELTVIEALVRMGELDGATHGLEDQRRVLRALSADLEAVIVDAGAEHAVVQMIGARRCPPVLASANGAGATRRPASRPRLALALAAIVLGVVVAVPGLRQEPLRALWVNEERAARSEIHAARQRLATLQPSEADADEVAAETRAVHDEILALPDGALESRELRAEIRELLAAQSGTLRDLPSKREATRLLHEVRALSASLGIDLPASTVKPQPTSPDLPSPEQPQPKKQPKPGLVVPDLPRQPKQPEHPSVDLPARERPAPPSLDAERPGVDAPEPAQSGL